MGWASDFGSGHDLEVRGFEPRVGLCLQLRAWSLLWILCPPLSLLLPGLHSVPVSLSKRNKHWGAWGAQSVTRLTSAQVVISRSVSLSPVSGSVRTARSLEPASDSVSPSLFVPPLLVLSLSLLINK